MTFNIFRARPYVNYSSLKNVMIPRLTIQPNRKRDPDLKMFLKAWRGDEFWWMHVHIHVWS